MRITVIDPTDDVRLRLEWTTLGSSDLGGFVTASVVPALADATVGLPLIAAGEVGSSSNASNDF